jgi:hypothetical protein
MPENIAAVAPSFDLSRVSAELMRTAAGRAQLEALTKSQKSLKPETVTVKEGDIIYSVPTTPGGAYTPILSGGKKPTPFTGGMGNAALVLYQTNDPEKIFKEFGQDGLNAVSKKAEADELAKAPKINVDVRDPTAVAKASLDTMNKWEGFLKASGDIELANRYSNLQSSIELARNGNPSADGASLYNLAKIYDPSGAVQEGDKKSILGNASIPEKVKLLAQQFYAGGTFTPTQRNNILIIAKEIRDQRNTQLERYRKEYVNVITKFGGSAESIFNPYSINQKPANLSAIITAPPSK